MPWKQMLAYVTGEVDEKLLAQNEYLLEENRALRNQIKGRVRLNDPERRALAIKAMAMGKMMADVVTIVKPDTILRWHRRLVARKYDGSKHRKYPGRPRLSHDIQTLVIKLATENPTWGYDRISGALKNLGYKISDQSIGNILKANGIKPTTDRTRETTWANFIRQHKDVLWATDFFTAEAWTASGLTSFYVLFFIQLSTRKIYIAGITEHPNERWMAQVARNIIDWDSPLKDARYIIHDRDTKYCASFAHILKSADIKTLKLPARSPNLNAYAERFVKSIKTECLDRLILFGEKSLRHTIREYINHYHSERNHQGIENLIPFPDERNDRGGKITKAERLGGLLNYYHRAA